MTRIKKLRQGPFVRLPDSPIVSISAPPAGEHRTRQVVKRSNARPTGKYPSWKMNRMMQWESQYELRAFKLLDADPTVRYFYEQPIEVQYEMNGTVLTHYPDILIVTESSKLLWEVKPQWIATRPDIAERAALMMRELPRYGYEYKMVIGEDFSREPRLASVETLLRYGQNPISSEERERIRNLFVGTPATTWGAVLDGALGLNSRSHACRLMLEGFLSWNPEQPLTRKSALTWAVSPSESLVLPREVSI